MKPPCIVNGVDCPNRRPGCQTNCPKLVPLHEHLDKIKKARAQEAIYNQYIIPVLLKNSIK
jgi:hypothetical protein